MDAYQGNAPENMNTSFRLNTQERCVNWTSTLVSVIQHALEGSARINTKGNPKDEPETETLPHNSSSTGEEEEDLYAFLYIIFVLLFFASSLVVLLIRYLRSEKETSKVQKFYDRYMEVQPPRYILRNAQGYQLTWSTTEGRFLQEQRTQTIEENHNPVSLGNTADGMLQQMNLNAESRLSQTDGKTCEITRMTIAPPRTTTTSL